MSKKTANPPLPTLRNMLDMYWLGEARRKSGLHSYELAYLSNLTAQRYGAIEMGRVKATDEEMSRIKAALDDQNSEVAQHVNAVIKAARSLSAIQLRQLSDVLKVHYKPSQRS